MSEPSVPELPDDVAALVARTTASSGGPPPDVAHAILARIHATVGAPPPGGSSAGPSVLPRASGVFRRATLGKLAIVVIGLGGAGGGSLAALRLAHRTEATPRTAQVAPVEPAHRGARADQPVLPVVAPSPPVAARIAEPTPSLAPTAPGHPATGARRAAAEGLGGETLLIDAARSALSRGDGAAAIAVLREHAQRYPHGRMREERESQWVVALARSGQPAAARAREARFERTWPHSMFLRVVRSAVGAHEPP